MILRIASFNQSYTKVYLVWHKARSIEHAVKIKLISCYYTTQDSHSLFEIDDLNDLLNSNFRLIFLEVQFF